MADISTIRLELRTEGLRQGVSALDRVAESGRRVDGVAAQVEASFARMGRAVRDLAAAYLGLNAVMDTARTAMSFQAVELSFTAITGSVAGAKREMSYVTQEARRLGLNVTALAESYKAFSASASSVNMSAAQTREVFSNIGEAAAVMGLSAGSTRSVFVALEQMLSKGVVSTQELKLQMGNALPGAMGIAAKAMGVTQTELGKLLEQGKLVSTDFVPRFSQAVKEHFAGGVVSAMTTATSEVTKLQNALTLAQVTIGESGFLQGIAEGAREMREAFESVEVRRSMENLGEILGGITGTLGEVGAAALEHAGVLKALGVVYGAHKISALAFSAGNRAAVASIVQKTTAVNTSITATVTSARADMEAARASHQAALASLEKARAEYAEFDSAGRVIGITNQQVAAYQRLIAAERAATATGAQLAVSNEALAVAQARATFGARMLAGAQALFTATGKGLKSLSNFLGGPWVLGATAAAAAVYAIATADNSAEAAAKSYGSTLQDMEEKYKNISQQAQEAADKTNKLTESHKKALEEQRKLQAEAEKAKMAERLSVLREMADESHFAASSENDAGKYLSVDSRLIGDFRETTRLLQEQKISADEAADRYETLRLKAEKTASGMTGWFNTARRATLAFATDMLKARNEATSYHESSEIVSKSTGEVAVSLKEAAAEVMKMETAVRKLADLFKLAAKFKLSPEEFAAKQLAAEVEEYNRAIAALANDNRQAEASVASLNLAMLQAGAESGGFSSMQEFVRAREDISTRLEKIELGEAEFSKRSAEQQYATRKAALQAVRDTAAAHVEIERIKLSQLRTLKAEEVALMAINIANGGKTVADMDALLAGMEKNYKKLLASFAGGGRSGGGGGIDRLQSTLASINDEIARLTMTEDAYSRLRFDQKIEEYRAIGVSLEKLAELTAAWTQAEQKKGLQKDADALRDFNKEMISLIHGETAARKQAIEEQAELYLDAGADRVQVERWVQEQMLHASDDFSSGAIRGFRNYAKDATNAAKNAETFVTSSISSMEDALVQFVSTGKMEFASLVNSIIADLARLAIRQAITGPLMGALGSALGGLFGGGGGSSFLAGAVSTGQSALASLGYHGGGIAGEAPTFTRTVPAALFADAPRYHKGGTAGLLPNEIPAILERGERIIPRGQASGGTVVVEPQVNINITNNTSAQVETRTSKDSNGGFNIDVLINEIDNRMAQRVSNGTSRTGAALDRTRNLNRASALYS